MKILKRIKATIRSRVFCSKTKNSSNKTPRIIGKVFLRQSPKIILGKNVTFYNNVILWGPGTIKFGDNCAVGDNVIIYSSKDGGISIGNDTLIAANSYLIDSDHSFLKNKLIRLQPMNIKPISIGNDVWIGANTTILKGLTIGDGAIVGANSLVNRSVDSFTVVAGVPAKQIKKR